MENRSKYATITSKIFIERLSKENMLTGLSGGVAGQQYQDQQQSDPYASALSGAMGVAGLFGQIYGGRKGI